MNKNCRISDKRISLLVKAWVESEIEPLRDQEVGFIKKYFRYDHLGRKLIRKISSIKNAEIIIRSTHGDSDIIIRKGDYTKETYEVTIKRDELCLSKL